MSDSQPDREAILKAICKHTRTARMSLGLTQEEIARRIGISVEFYARIERGRCLPSTLTLINIAQTLTVSLDWLVGRISPPPQAALAIAVSL